MGTKRRPRIILQITAFGFEDLGEPGEVPMPSDHQPAPPEPPLVQDLNKSAASPELLPLPR